MTDNTHLSVLPDDTAQRLVDLKGSNQSEFFELVYALKKAGWSLRALAEPFGVSRTAAAQWVKKHDGPVNTQVPKPPKAEPKTVTRNREEAYTLTDDESSELHRLATKASTVRRYTDAHSPARKAASDLESKLSRYVELGVTKRKLAQHCGVSESSIKQRLRKL